MSIKFPDTLKSNNPKEFGIVEASEVVGSKTVNKLSDLYKIPDGLLTTNKTLGENSLGNLYYVISEKTHYYLSDYNKRNEAAGWTILSGSGGGGNGIGIPTLDQDLINQLSDEGIKLPDDYIIIPNKPKSDFEKINTDSSIGETGTNYLDILFRSIRSLQAEVAKLRNTMTFGMYSYTDERTAMSRVVDEYKPLADNEPLWAVEESDLSKIDDAFCEISERHNLTPKDNVHGDDGILSINLDGAKWQDPSDGNGFKKCNDAKLFLYLTTSNKNVTLTLNNLNDNLSYQKILNLSSLPNIPKSLSKKYNILIAVSRAYKNKGDEEYQGKNFVWVQVTTYGVLTPQWYGYWNTKDNKLQDELYEIGGDSKTAKEDNRLYINNVEFKNINLYKFNAYSKYQDFSTEVSPVNPSDDNYKYGVAHITIRSVKNEDVLKSIVKQLPKNELIYNEQNNGLYIINKVGNYKQLNTSKEDSGMTKAEIKEWLDKNGIHLTEDGNENITIDNLADITFIHQETGKAYKFACTADGQLKSSEIPNTSLAKRMQDAGYSLTGDSPTNIRGFVGKLGYNELKASSSEKGEESDIGLYSDRVKIAAIYAPHENQSSYGCSHAYVELENTSDKDFQLSGCYLQFAQQGTDESNTTYLSIALDGVIPAGGTYLIRGKQYTEFDQANCFIKVKSYDKEWYKDGELVDLTLNNKNTFLLTYGKSFSYDKNMVTPNTSTEKSVLTKKPYLYHPNYIDSVTIGNHITYSNQRTWTAAGYEQGEEGSKYEGTYVQFIKNTRDCIYKNTFQLDPAKQAFQSLNTYDSSRYRNANAQDYQYLFIDDDKIEFPKSDGIRSVDYYTPKASFEKKNVSTDKSKLDPNKPNMTTCSFGIDIHKTRCFNWISQGSFNEYLWVKKQSGGDETWSRFESYKGSDGNDSRKDVKITKKSFNTTFYNKTTKKDETIESVIYDRIQGTFPGCGIKYTSHKCIIDIDGNNGITSPLVYEYIVGRADKNGNPDPNHCSEKQTFTIYPKTYIPKVFQITDQQGFHWIEYQVWAAAAKVLNDEINSQLSATDSKIIPVLINTGDMTQNGSRINEWYDYYEAGKVLFNHLEQMNVVGNNDLCGTNPEVLGTGDDAGKSNSFYFHLCYCYEVNPDILPIITNSNATHYIPSLYYFGNEYSSTDEEQKKKNSYRFIMTNSEITIENCKSWFKQIKDGETVNVYTGWPINTKGYDSSFTTIYTMLYKMMNDYENNIVAVCHEMPFTVITNSNLVETKTNIDRSLNGSSLVGSHMNRLGITDTKANYWFSRLLEHFNVKLCIGGHKHTYACTNPIREYYYYNDGTPRCSLDQKMTMSETLSNDSATFNVTLKQNSSGRYVIGGTSGDEKEFHTSKYPLMQSSLSGIGSDAGKYYPYYGDDSLTGGIVYFMLQATGFKLKSNKELPSASQQYSYVIPTTTTNGKTGDDTPDINQQYPMYAEIKMLSSNYDIYLCRIGNIMDGKELFSQIKYSTKPISCEYLSGDVNNISGYWSNEKVKLIQIDK